MISDGPFPIIERLIQDAEKGKRFKVSKEEEMPFLHEIHKALSERSILIDHFNAKIQADHVSMGTDGD
ncbi:MAG: hypothetical protein AAF198_06345 [Pseudomonadota bacterium]